MKQTHYDGAAALVLVLYQTRDGRQNSMFPNARVPGLNRLILSMMPKQFNVSQSMLWLKAFERSGHYRMPQKRIVPRFLRARPAA
jgi:hypothetical protein